MFEYGRCSARRNSDGTHFRYILNYLRTGKLTIPDDKALMAELLVEASFYRIESLVKELSGVEEQQQLSVKKAANLLLFEGSTLLSAEQQQQLNKLFGDANRRWKLLYKATRDGFRAANFHAQCDNKGATITVIRSTGGYLFGGYTAINWNSSSGNYGNDAQAFLFTLTNPNGIQPTKYQCTNAGYAILNHPSYGPTFGAGHDLNVADNSNANNSSRTKFPRSYQDTTGHGNNTFVGARNFQTTEIEVFAFN